MYFVFYFSPASRARDLTKICAERLDMKVFTFTGPISDLRASVTFNLPMTDHCCGKGSDIVMASSWRKEGGRDGKDKLRSTTRGSGRLFYSHEY